MEEKYLVRFTQGAKSQKVQGTIPYLMEYFDAAIKSGKENEQGNKIVNLEPKNIDELIECLNNAAYNTSAKDNNPIVKYETFTIPNKKSPSMRSFSFVRKV